MATNGEMITVMQLFQERVQASHALGRRSAAEVAQVNSAFTDEPLPWRQATTGMVAKAVGCQSPLDGDSIVEAIRDALAQPDFEPVAERFIKLVLAQQQPQ